MRPLIYISGPMTLVEDFNRPAFQTAEDALREAGFPVRNPARLHFHGEDPEYDAWLKAALILMLECDGVALLPGWQTSKGACIEVELARKLNMRIANYNDWIEGHPHAIG